MSRAAKERAFLVQWVALMREHEVCVLPLPDLIRRAREIREACA